MRVASGAVAVEVDARAHFVAVPRRVERLRVERQDASFDRLPLLLVRNLVYTVVNDDVALLYLAQAWCAKRQLILFVLALNIALAVTFYKLLYE